MKSRFITALIVLITIQTVGIFADELHVPSRTYPDIATALSFADDGDTIIIDPCVYTGSGNVNLDPGGPNNITIKSWVDPENPNWDIINSTIIDCQGSKYNRNRAF